MSDVALVTAMVRGFSEPGPNGETHQLYCGNDVRNRDHTFEAPADCVATFEQKAHSWALNQMQETMEAKVVASATVEETPR